MWSSLFRTKFKQKTIKSEENQSKMLKKYAKRFSQTIMGGLGPIGGSGGGGQTHAAHQAMSGSKKNLSDCSDSSMDSYRWPPQSRKVIDDEVVTIEQTSKEEVDQHNRRKPPMLLVNAKEKQRGRRQHLSSCSSNTSAAATTGEEGFGSESSLDDVRIMNSKNKALSDGGQESKGTMTMTLDDRHLFRKPSSTSTSSTLSSTSESLATMVNQLRSTLFYYAAKVATQ